MVETGGKIRVFNPEKLLGGMLMGGTRRRGGLGGMLSGGSVALGLVGVAMAAVEHYTDKSHASTGGAVPPVPPPGRLSGTLPPPPVPGVSQPPPPLPEREAPAVPPTTGKSSTHKDAVLLIRAMIAAANADGVIDQEERHKILSKLQSVDLSREEHAFIANELLAPRNLEEIIKEVQSQEMAREVYAVSLMAIEVDTEAEKTYMNTLAKGLGLSDAALDEIHTELGIGRR
ncbi:MAG: hypothetical protein DRG82_00915 [Deltaproteobacteria bacterium]|nr:MAG: hypothetical protein DRG82_00915 [Deltaproteobacteria bacterium]